ncbi:DUF4177 domain-containing protein [Desulforhopalus sp. 52FAK]
MRWSYKTVHYELKKEGLLGSTFLDESEVELSLNEYGKSGWELVSLLETMDGLVAVFKQPLSLETDSFYPSVQEEEELQNEEVESPEEEQFVVEPLSTEDDSTYDEVVVVEEFDVIGDEEPKPEKAKKNRTPDADVGSIIIE